MEWYCIHTKPRKEAALAYYLEEVLGLDVYYPRMKTRKLVCRVKRVVVQPLFPRYLFCRFSLEEHFRAVRYAQNSLGPINCGEMPIAVRESIIEQMKDQFGMVFSRFDLESGFESGDCIQILDGPMQGLTGTVLRNLSAGERVAVLLGFLNCDTRVNIEKSRVALVDV